MRNPPADRAVADALEIVRVLHAARDIHRIL
jgi:plasmid stabilization system protein ParE